MPMEANYKISFKDLKGIKSGGSCNEQHSSEFYKVIICHPCSWVTEAGRSRRGHRLSPSHTRRFSTGKMIMWRLLLLLLLLFAGIVILIILKHINFGYSNYEAMLRKRTNFTLYRNKERTKFSKNRTVIQDKQLHQNRKSSLGNPFNPEEFDNSTANTNKKYIILYWSKIRGYTARIQRKAEYEQNPHVWPYTYAGDTCPVQCELTNNRSRAHEASAFVVHSRLTDVWDVPPLQYLTPWILQNNENPVYTPALSDSKTMSKFNLLISYRLDSDFPSPIYPKPSLDPPLPFKDRLGTVLAVFSKCEPVRTEYMRQLMKYIQVDSYGACLKNKKGLIGLYGQINGRYVFKDYKFVMSRYYKFSLVFMNQDCDYFVDDRLYHALETGSIPIYMGTDKIDPFLPGNLKNAIINVRDFKSPKNLAEYLKYLSNNETAFNKYMEWKYKGIGDYRNTTIGRWWDQKYPLFCQVCMRLAQGGLHNGLDVDHCKARTFEDWGLDPPYPTEIHRNVTDTRPKEKPYVTGLALVGIAATILIFIANTIKCWMYLGTERPKIYEYYE